MNILNRISELFTKVQPLPEGAYHLQSAPERAKPYRLHLRLLKDGTGILVVNAATVLHLNPNAAECAYHFIKGSSPDEAAKQIAARYRVSKEAALKDFTDFADRIQTLVETPDLDPVSYLDFDRVAPHSANLPAPLRLDCALTYRLSDNSDAAYAPAQRVKRELTTEEWQSILDKAWSAGIPHVTFTGGEATLRDDLPQLIARAEANGQICGLLTDGLKLADETYRANLLQTGLDHILFLLQPGNTKSWDALETLLREDIFVTAHLTVNPENAGQVDGILERLATLGVKSLSVTAADKSLTSSLPAFHNRAAELGMTLRFDLPVPYSAENPVAYETAEEAVLDGAGRAWMYVEPDGDTLPAQGMKDQILGNFLNDKWEAIRRA
ncbi:MAG TPA: radical SAM protein [Anaerolineales bacterium]|nr:radical SAM protein [Anaerolineales bacterium]